MAESDPIPLLTGLIQLTVAQLAEAWAEVRDQNTYLLALAALSVAVMGIIAGVRRPLGADWWVPLPGLAATVSAALSSTAGVTTSLGPSATSFYEDFGESPAAESMAQLLSDLVAAVPEARAALRRQRSRLQLIFGLVAVTATYSIVVLALI